MHGRGFRRSPAWALWTGLLLSGASLSCTRSQPPSPAPAPRTAAHETEPPATSISLQPAWTVPEEYEGKLVRSRVRFFPRKLLALTFDDGPDPEITPQVLQTLAKHRARATFFVLGHAAERHPELLRRIVAEGHVLGNHSYSHAARLSAAKAREELQRTSNLIEAASGTTPTLFRPPYGIVNGAFAHAALQAGGTGVLWTISSADSKPIGPEIIARNVVHTPNPGDIVLLHDGPGHRATAAALPRILTELGAAGFQFVTIPQLLQAWAEWSPSTSLPPTP